MNSVFSRIARTCGTYWFEGFLVIMLLLLSVYMGNLVRRYQYWHTPASNALISRVLAHYHDVQDVSNFRECLKHNVSKMLFYSHHDVLFCQKIVRNERIRRKQTLTLMADKTGSSVPGAAGSPARNNANMHH